MVGDRGHSLAELLVSVAIISIFAVISAETFRKMDDEARFASERLGSVELHQSMLQVLARKDLCSGLFASANLESSSVLPFNSTAVTPATPYKFKLQRILAADGTTLVTPGTRVSPISNTLWLNSAAAARPGIQVEITSMNPPTALLRLNFDQKKLVRPMVNLTLRIKLKTTGTPAATNIVECST